MANRIEEVKKILLDFAYGKYNTEKLNVEEQVEWKAKLICQLFPQPLDDKELREKIKDAGRKCSECLGTGTFYKEYHGSQCYKCEGRGVIVDDDQILALLQPKIEEARKQRDIQWVKFLMKEKSFMCDIPPEDYGQALKGGE